MPATYTGIGSRSAPDFILMLMEEVGYRLAKRGDTLRSGGAPGSDEAFERGCDRAGGSKEIYLPWQRFNNNSSPLYQVGAQSIALASAVHPAWSRCNERDRLFHGRNIYQVLGRGIEANPPVLEPSRFLICWTPNGRIAGGTATAITIAMQHEIPVCNLAVEQERRSLCEKLGLGQFWAEEGW